MLHIPESLHYRPFRLLWSGLLISIAGSQMQVAALLWHIRTLTDQPIALGGIGLARIVPIVIFSLIGGAVADSLNRRKLMFLTQTVMALSALALAWLTFSGQVTLVHIYLLTALQATAGAFDTPARQSLVPNLVPARVLPNAFSMSSIAFQSGAIIGPAAGGLVIASLGLGYAYLFNAISYGAVIVALMLMGPVKQVTTSNGKPAVSLIAIREGVGFILGHPIILSTMLLDFFATFFSSARTLLPIFARDILHVGAMEYGWLVSADSIGAVLAAIIFSQLGEVRHQGRVFLWAVVFYGLATVAFGVAPTFTVALFALMLIGASDSVSMIIRSTIRQLQTPDYIRGRMVSINQIFFMGGPQLGEIEAGVVAQLLGAPFAVVSGGLASVLAVIWVAHRWPQLRSYSGDEPLAAGGEATA